MSTAPTGPKADAPAYSDADKARARQWFKKAADCRERREHDYAIECYITGLGYWPEAVEEGHMPLSSLSLQRAQAGGKKPGMMEAMKRPTTGKDAKACMLNAEFLLAKEPGSPANLDALVKNAARGGFHETLKWIAPKAMDSLRKDAKPSLPRFKAFRQALVEAAAAADAAGDAATAAQFYEQAVGSIDFLLARNLGDAALRDEQRDLSGKHTIARGKYSESETFRDSVRDIEKQTLLHDADRVQSGDQQFDNVIAAARREWSEQPTAANRITALAEALVKRERKAEEDEAVTILNEAWKTTRNYSFKSRADDIELRQLKRQKKQLDDAAAASGSEEDQQQARLAGMELAQREIDVYRDRVGQYPTDMRMRFRLGESLMAAGEYDEAIPVLQAAQHDPRVRVRALLLIGRAFHEKGAPAESVELIKEALAAHDTGNDELGKEMLYRLALAYEADGNRTEARATLGKLLRLDYGYAGGDARKRMDALK